MPPVRYSLISLLVSLSFSHRINLTSLSSTRTLPPKNPRSISITPPTSILLVLAGEIRLRTEEVVEVEVAAVVVRDLVRDAWGVSMMFVGRSVEVVDRL